jgi:hypothetical protein
MSKNLISLKVKCPHCSKSLMDYTHYLNAKPSIKLVVEVGGQNGILNLCSTYGCYDKTATVHLTENEIAVMGCPACKRNLPQSASCVECGAPIVDMAIEKGGIVHVCSRIGCKNHYVTFSDMNETLTEFYNEFDYGSHETES